MGQSDHKGPLTTQGKMTTGDSDLAGPEPAQYRATYKGLTE